MKAIYKIPDFFEKPGILLLKFIIAIALLLILGVHNRVSGSLITEDAVWQKKILSHRHFIEENHQKCYCI
ncbi:MAG: hypothetical protein KME55_15270 [Nostoc indistinguendum CM1-VF10]|jgi:hypothetical protein|nr:hypothetical protein [Nostoc indistinguendum CM1-VF10]